MTGRTIRDDIHGDTDWQQHAACARSRIDMFPTDLDGVERAVAVCDQCPVRHPCLTFALDNRIGDGVWGGHSERERRRMRRAKGAA